MKINEFFGTRHSIKPKGEDKEAAMYKGISEKGETLSKERAKELLEMIENAPAGAVVFIGGASDQIRTKSTAEVYGEEIKKIVAEKGKDIMVFNREDVADSKKGYSEIVKNLAEKINNNPNKKIVIDFPMFIKEFAQGSRFLDKNGEMNEFTRKLLEKGGTEEGALKVWIKSEGIVDGIDGPNPKKVAEEQLHGIKRLYGFAEKNIEQKRPIIVGFVGHSLILDVLAIYLANDGEISLSGYEKIGGKMSKETETAILTIENNRTVFKYRGCEYEISQ